MVTTDRVLSGSYGLLMLAKVNALKKALELPATQIGRSEASHIQLFIGS